MYKLYKGKGGLSTEIEKIFVKYQFSVEVTKIISIFVQFNSIGRYKIEMFCLDKRKKAVNLISSYKFL